MVDDIKRLTISVPVDFYDLLQDASKRYGVSISGFIRLSVLEKIRKDGVIDDEAYLPAYKRIGRNMNSLETTKEVLET